MNLAKLFAIVMICLQVAACICYALQKDYHRATYWFGAIVVTGAVTF
jgi:uncharacterized MAPEG superfamily protein